MIPIFSLQIDPTIICCLNLQKKMKMTRKSAVEIGGGGLVVDKRVAMAERDSRSHKIVKKRICRRKGIMKLASVHSQVAIHRMGLQRLFLACQNIFKAPQIVPSSTDVQRIQRILDTMLPEDVGLNSNLQFFKQKDVVDVSARVKYSTIYQCKDFSLSLFFLPSSAVIPLHNHPGMTVFNKLLLGTMHIKSYDLIESCGLDTQNQASKLRLARLKSNKIISSPCDSTVLYPKSGGNIHELKAITPCAVLDVIGPPYSKSDGRDCSYYKESDRRNSSFSSNAWLEEIETPEESNMDMIDYMGPPVYMAPAMELKHRYLSY